MSKDKWLIASLCLCMVSTLVVPFISTTVHALIMSIIGLMAVLCLYKGIWAHIMRLP